MRKHRTSNRANTGRLKRGTTFIRNGAGDATWRVTFRNYKDMPILLQRLHQLILRKFGSEVEYVRQTGSPKNTLTRLFGRNKGLNWKFYSQVLNHCDADEGDIFGDQVHVVEAPTLLNVLLEIKSDAAGNYKVQVLSQTQRKAPKTLVSNK